MDHSSSLSCVLVTAWYLVFVINKILHFMYKMLFECLREENTSNFPTLDVLHVCKILVSCSGIAEVTGYLICHAMLIGI